MARMNLNSVLILMGLFCILISIDSVSARTLDFNLVFYRHGSVYKMYVLVTEDISLDHLRIGENYTLEVLDSNGALIVSIRGLSVDYLQPGDDYTFEVLNPDREAIVSQTIGIPIEDFDKKLNILNVRFLYQEDMDIIRLLRDGNEVYSTDLSRYASGESTTTSIVTTLLTTIPTTTMTTSTSTTTIRKVFNCGNSVCDSMENHKNCPQDCPSGSEDGYCDWIEDGICDPDCYPWEDLDCELGTTTLATTLPTTIPATIPTSTSTTTTTLMTMIPTTTSTPATLQTTIPTTIPTTSLETTTTILPGEEKEDYSYLTYIGGALIIIVALFVIIRKVRSRKTLKKVGEGELRYWIEGKLKMGENPELLKKALERQGSDPKIVDEIMQKMWRSSAEVI